MIDPYLGEIRMISGTYAPKGWTFCEGQVLPIGQNQALFALLGTTYGGDGQTTFALPDLRGRVPVHWGLGSAGVQINLGDTGGEENHTLTATEMPQHNHLVNASSAWATLNSPANAVWASTVTNPYTAQPNQAMNAGAITPSGGATAHSNMQPYMVMNFCIALEGILPTRGLYSMSDAFLGEIRMFAGNFSPDGWSLCNGQLLPISQYTTLFSILSNRFGGDGQTTFALPDLCARVPMHQGTGSGLTQRTVGQTGGSATVTLTQAQMPSHTHTAMAIATTGNQGTPVGNIWAEGQRSSPHSPPPNLYGPTPDTTMNAMALSVAGGSQPHNNMQPYLGLSFIICTNGLFPPHP